MITVYIKKISDIHESEKQSIINSLSASARERLNKKRNEDLRLASLIALSLLTDEQRENLDYTENGCPFFTNLDADISISHSKTHVAVAISSSKSIHIGLDIEDITSTSMPTRFLTENEKKSMQNDKQFIEIWTKKEALFKFLKNASFPLFHLDSTAPESYGAQFSIMQIEKLILTVCARENEKIEIIRK